MNWAEFEAAEPLHAAGVKQRFAQHKHHVLATLRADGSPRLTGLEVDIRDGELWLGMMPDSRKALDLRRDARFAVHANPGPGSDLADGDVRVSGRAVEITDPAVLAWYAQGEEEGQTPERFFLFRAELTEVVRTFVDIPDLCLDVWRPGRPMRTIRRGNDDAAPREDVQRPPSA